MILIYHNYTGLLDAGQAWHANRSNNNCLPTRIQVVCILQYQHLMIIVGQANYMYVYNIYYTVWRVITVDVRGFRGFHKTTKFLPMNIYNLIHDTPINTRVYVNTSIYMCPRLHTCVQL